MKSLRLKVVMSLYQVMSADVVPDLYLSTLSSLFVSVSTFSAVHGQKYILCCDEPDISVQRPAGRPPHTSSVSLSCYCRVTAVSLPRYCRVTAMLVLFYCRVTAALVLSYCRVTAALLPCHCRVTAALLLRYCRVTAASLPR